MKLDSRRTPARPDLAAEYLKGEIEAERYVEATRMVVSAPYAPMTAQPNGDARLTNQLLYGEPFAAYEMVGGWAWGQAERDGYVGYVPGACLLPAGPAPTHRVAQPMALVYATPAVKIRIRMITLSAGDPIPIDISESSRPVTAHRGSARSANQDRRRKQSFIRFSHL